jgi:hypothetical protein
MTTSCSDWGRRARYVPGRHFAPMADSYKSCAPGCRVTADAANISSASV